MDFLNATIEFAKLRRDICLCVFKDDTREKLYARYFDRLAKGPEAPILKSLLSMLCENDVGDISVSVKFASYGPSFGVTDDSSIKSIEDICELLSLLSFKALYSRRDPWD